MRREVRVEAHVEVHTHRVRTVFAVVVAVFVVVSHTRLFLHYFHTKNQEPETLEMI